MTHDGTGFGVHDGRGQRDGRGRGVDGASTTSATAKGAATTPPAHGTGTA